MNFYTITTEQKNIIYEHLNVINLTENINIKSYKLSFYLLDLINKITKDNFVLENNIVQIYKNKFPFYINNYIKAFILLDNDNSNLIVTKNNITDYKGLGICIYIKTKYNTKTYDEIISKL